MKYNSNKSNLDYWEPIDLLNSNKEDPIKIILEYKSREQDYILQNQLYKKLIKNYAKHNTDIIKANEVLKKQSILFDNAKDIILYLKSDRSIIDANKTAVEIIVTPTQSS